jgi:hypothetical protein
MSDLGGDRSLVRKEKLSVGRADQALELVSKVVPLLDPAIGQIAQLCAAAIREHRLEVEARLSARLEELAAIFSALEIAQERQVEERERQFRALSILLDVSQILGVPTLVREAMTCFREYVRTTPTYTQDVTRLASALQAAADSDSTSGSSSQ